MSRSPRRRWALLATSLAAVMVAAWVVLPATRKTDSPTPRSASPSRDQPQIGRETGVSQPVLEGALPRDATPVSVRPEAVKVSIRGLVLSEEERAVSGGAVTCILATPTHTAAAEQRRIPVQADGTFVAQMDVARCTEIALFYVDDGVHKSPGWFHTVERSDREDHSVTLLAFRAATTEVSVLDVAGRPVEGASVTPVPRSHLGEVGVTGADGRCTLQVVADPLTALRAMSRAGEEGQTKALWLQPGDRRAVEIRLDRRWSEVQVRCVAPRQPELSGMPSRVDFREAGQRHSLLIDGPSIPVLLPPSGRLSCSLTVVGLGTTQFAWKDWSGGGGRAELLLVLEPCGVLDLRVADGAGAPVDGLTVELRAAGGTSEELRAYPRRTDSRGQAKWGLLPFGTYHLVVDGLTDEEVQLNRLVVQHELTTRGTTAALGTFVGPNRIGGSNVEISVHTEDGRVASAPAPAGRPDARPWHIALAGAPGASATIEVRCSGQSLVTPLRTVLGQETTIDISDACVTIHPVAGSRRRLRGWLELVPLGTPTSGWNRRTTFIEMRSGDSVFPRPPPGEYEVWFSADMWGRERAGRVPRVLSIVQDEARYIVDFGP